MEKTLRKISCINKRNNRICGNYLGDMIADEVGEFNSRPCNQCGVQWNVKQEANGLLTYRKVPKDEVKNYDNDTLIIEEESHAAR